MGIPEGGEGGERVSMGIPEGGGGGGGEGQYMDFLYFLY